MYTMHTVHNTQCIQYNSQINSHRYQRKSGMGAEWWGAHAYVNVYRIIEMQSENKKLLLKLTKSIKSIEHLTISTNECWRVILTYDTLLALLNYEFVSFWTLCHNPISIRSIPYANEFIDQHIRFWFFFFFFLPSLSPSSFLFTFWAALDVSPLLEWRFIAFLLCIHQT